MIVNTQEQIALLKRLAVTDVNCCIQCGRCSANCPAAYKMDILPHRMVWELMQGNATTLLEANSPWKCISCFACAQRCPRGVSPVAVMEAVRLTAIRAQGGNKLDPVALENYDSDMPQQALVAAFRKYNK